MAEIYNVTMKDAKGNTLNPASVGTQIALTAQNGVEKANVQEELEALHTKVDGLLVNADALQFKGMVNSDTDIPTTYKSGWVWKVGTPGTYKGKVCEAGDLILANTDRDGTGNTDNDFDVFQGNVDRPVSGPDTATNEHLPIFDGTDGMKLKDSAISLAAVQEGLKKAFVVIDHGAAIPTDELRADAIVFEKSA